MVYFYIHQERVPNAQRAEGYGSLADGLFIALIPAPFAIGSKAPN
jgi:hypothetical protein